MASKKVEVPNDPIVVRKDLPASLRSAVQKWGGLPGPWSRRMEPARDAGGVTNT